MHHFELLVGSQMNMSMVNILNLCYFSIFAHVFLIDAELHRCVGQRRKFGMNACQITFSHAKYNYFFVSMAAFDHI